MMWKSLFALSLTLELADASTTSDLICAGIDAAEGPVTDLVVNSAKSAFAGNALVSFGVDLLASAANVVADKYIKPELCDKDEDEDEDDESTNDDASSSRSEPETALQWNQRRGRSLMTSLGVSVNATSLSKAELPDDCDPFKCVDFPTDSVPFCAHNGFSYKVSEAFQDSNFALLRNLEMESLYSKITENEHMNKLLESSLLCKMSVKDALCVDAVPNCKQDDISLCTIACRNVQICFSDLYDFQSASALQPVVDKCTDSCKKSSIALVPPEDAEGDDIFVEVGAQVVVRGAGEDGFNGPYTARQVHETTTVGQGSAIQFVHDDDDSRAMAYFPRATWPAAWYMSFMKEPPGEERKQFDSAYVLMHGDEFHMPQAKWRVSTEAIYGSWASHPLARTYVPRFSSRLFTATPTVGNNHTGPYALLFGAAFTGVAILMVISRFRKSRYGAGTLEDGLGLERAALDGLE